MFNSVIVMLERAAGVVRRVNEDTLDLASKFLFESRKGKKVVAEDERLSNKSWSVTRCGA